MTEGTSGYPSRACSADAQASRRGNNARCSRARSRTARGRRPIGARRASVQPTGTEVLDERWCKVALGDRT